MNGQHYYFVSEEEFDNLVESDGLLEWARYQSARYGTPRAEIEQKVAEGRAVIMEVETQGALQIMARLDKVRTIFLMPPSLAELESRLRGRGTESDESIKLRLQIAKHEMSLMDEFDHIIVNSEVAVAVDELVNLIGLSTGEQLD
jgi:guanylate kinase